MTAIGPGRGPNNTLPRAIGLVMLICNTTHTTTGPVLAFSPTVAHHPHPCSLLLLFIAGTQLRTIIKMVNVWAPVMRARRAGGYRARMPRKRKYNGRYYGRAPKRGTYRTEGYYGRYNGSGGKNGVFSELKFHDLDFNATPILATGVIKDTVIEIPQNTTEKGRLGRKVVLRSVGWRFEIKLPVASESLTPVDGDVVRIMMLHDKQANGATATVTDVLETADFQSFNNLAHSHRFITLMDKSYAISYMTGGSESAGTFSSNEVIIQDTMFKKINLPIEYNATLGAMTEIRSNNVFLLLISRDGRAEFSSKIRFRYEG